MNRKIEFYIPKDEKIPTDLRLKVDEKDVFYKRAKEGLAYEFEIFNLADEVEGLSIVEDLSRIICDQSDTDGYTYWIVTEIIQITKFEFSCCKWRVSFRVKDMY